MKTTHKILFPALIFIAALSVPAQAGGRHGHGGSQAAVAPAAPARGGTSNFRSGAGSGFRYSGGRMIAPSQRFSSQRFSSVRGTSLSQRRFTSGTLNRPRLDGGPRFENNRANRSRNLGAIQRNRGNRSGSLGNSNRNLSGRNNHVFAKRSANWHRDWNRHHDHWWNGHRCRWVNGSWVIFDLGFYPWYGYPYDYYSYDPYIYPYAYPNNYEYGYDPGVYEGGVYEGTDPGYDQSKDGYNDSSNQNDSTVATAQELLAKQGYYRGEIDGIFGPATQRAIAGYQRNHGLQVTGSLTTETLRSLGSDRVARY